jgi:hypothetical protein
VHNQGKGTEARKTLSRDLEERHGPQEPPRTSITSNSNAAADITGSSADVCCVNKIKGSGRRCCRRFARRRNRPIAFRLLSRRRRMICIEDKWTLLFELCRRTQQLSLTVHPIDGSTFGLWPLFHLRDGGKWTEMTATQHGGALRH